MTLDLINYETKKERDVMYFLVSDEHKFLIGWSAKAGCSAIKRWFSSALNLNIRNKEIHKAFGYGNKPYTNIDKFPSQHYGDYKKICIIRDPYKRLISGYVNKYIIEKAYKQTWSNFSEFSELLLSDTGFKKINRHHFTPQTTEAFKKFINRKWAWDLVIDVSNLSKMAQDLNKLTGLTGILEHPNKTRYDSQYKPECPAYLQTNDELVENIPSYEHFFNDQIISIVKSKYVGDFLYFKEWGFEYNEPQPGGKQ